MLVVLGVSLYNYFDSRDLNQMTSAAHNNLLFDHRNQRYGAYSIRKTYNRVMLIVLAAVIVLFAICLGAQYQFFHGGKPNAMKPPIIMDTTLLSLNVPPKDEVPTLPPSYNIKSNHGSGGQNQNDQDKLEKRIADPTNPKDPEAPKNNNAKPDAPKEPEKPKVKSSSSEINELKDHTDDVMAQAKARAEARKAKAQQRQDAQKSQGNNTKSSNGNEGSQPKNQPMVDFVLNGRAPYDNDIWYVRNPGYTCGKGVAGTIVVNIKVNANGNVTSAIPASDVSGVDPCLVEKAIEYAKKSRFNSSAKAMQEGSITYKFKAQ